MPITMEGNPLTEQHKSLSTNKQTSSKQIFKHNITVFTVNICLFHLTTPNQEMYFRERTLVNLTVRAYRSRANTV